ncbi:MAG: hypothetical protein V7703_06845 [Hyphomicrobiales bacterium]
MQTRFLAAAAAFVLSCQLALAGSLVKVELSPIEHLEATLVVVGKDGTQTAYTPAELEAFPTYSLTTTTPWREETAKFEGVLLTDILASSGLDKIDTVTVMAENDYKTVFERELWENVDFLVATRVNGAAISRRARGPFLFVIDMDTLTHSEIADESSLVWMASRIEPGV